MAWAAWAAHGEAEGVAWAAWAAHGEAEGTRRNRAGHGAGALTGIDEPAGPDPMGPGPGPIGWYIGAGAPP